MPTIPAVPADLQRQLEAALGSTSISAQPLGASFGAHLLRLTAGGASYALKWAPGGAPAAMVAAEAHGLAALAACGAIRVPAIIAGLGLDLHPTARRPQVAAILTEWVEGGGASPDQAALGEQLAALHRHTAPAWGLERDNFIGGTPQANGWVGSWPAFFRERRLQPQIALATSAGLLPPPHRRALDRLLDQLDDRLAEPGAPSLIHGDLWGGNVLAGPGGAPALIDPAVSYSHREAEIAFTELFGGFSRRFYEAYGAAWPLEPGYVRRRPIYNLYHALNHVNLFGAGYLSLLDSLLGEAGP